jgi:RNA polymerase sigma factor (sigma-70 family)
MRLTKAQQKLAADYWPLALSLARPFKKAHPHLRDEFDSAVALALIGCARRYDGRIKFATYARHRLVGSLVDVLVRQGRETINLYDADDGIHERRTPDTARVDHADEVNRVLAGLPERTRRAMVLLHLHGLSQLQVAKVLGLRQTRICEIRQEAIQEILARRDSQHASEAETAGELCPQGLA